MKKDIFPHQNILFYNGVFSRFTWLKYVAHDFVDSLAHIQPHRKRMVSCWKRQHNGYFYPPHIPSCEFGFLLMSDAIGLHLLCCLSMCCSQGCYICQTWQNDTHVCITVLFIKLVIFNSFLNISALHEQCSHQLNNLIIYKNVIEAGSR